MTVPPLFTVRVPPIACTVDELAFSSAKVPWSTVNPRDVLSLLPRKPSLPLPVFVNVPPVTAPEKSD